MSKKPNIVMIYTDQHSKQYISCYNKNSVVKTPYIDSIADNGVKFNECFTPSAVCTPSRGCIMTGRYPHNNGAYRNGVPLKLTEDTIAHRLQENGYKTSYIGKWHLAGDKNIKFDATTAMGFEDYNYMIASTHHQKIIENINGDLELSWDIGDEQNYMTDFLTTKAIDYIENKVEKEPFFMVLSIPDPHQPYSVREPYASMFKPEDMIIPETFYQTDLPDWAEHDNWGRKRYFPLEMAKREQQLRSIMSQYCGEVKCIDDNVGRVLKCLKEHNLYEDTIIIFTSDHGEYMGEHGLLEKNNLFDSVYNVPFMMQWLDCDEVQKGAEVNGYFNVVDFKQTLIGLLGYEAFGNEQGLDASQVLTADIPDSWVQEAFIHPNDVPRAGIITPEYELAYVDHGWIKKDCPLFKDHILYDRKNDPKQINNLFKQPEYKEIIEKLRLKIIAHHEKMKTPIEALPKALFEETER